MHSGGRGHTRVFKDCLHTANLEGKPWKSFIPDFLQTYRATRHATTHQTPAELLHGHTLHTKLHIGDRQISVPAARLEDVRCCVEQKQDKSKRYTDKHRGAKPSTFQCGSFLRVWKPGLHQKGQNKYTQPL